MRVALLYWLSDMDKPNASPNTNALLQFKTLGDQLREELAVSYSRAREIENVLGVKTRILPEGEEAVPSTPDGTITGRRAARVSAPPRTFEVPPPGTIMHRVYEFLQKHPGSMAPVVRKALKMTSKKQSIQLSTALHTLKKRDLVVIKGRRNAFKYFAK
jgi:hypothetical protein